METFDQCTLSALEFLCGENNKLCRLCLSVIKSEEGAITLVNSVQIETTYCRDSLSYNAILAKLGIREEPLLPQVVCSNCSTILINSYLFQRLTEFTNKKWNIILKGLDDTLTQSDKLNLKNMKSAFAIIDKTDLFASHQKCTAKSKQKTVVNLNKIIKSYNNKKMKENDEFVCEECGKTFKANFLLMKHMRFHNKETHQCTYCTKVFSMQSYLEMHAERVHYPKKLKCEKCLKKFSTKRFLKHHLRTHHVPIKCNECKIELPSRKALKFHLDHHKVNTCPYCNKGYTNIKYFKLHKKYCGKIGNVASYTCDICKKNYQAKNGLKSHMKTAHGFGEVLSCKWCNKKFDVISRLNDHIVKHTKEKKFHCEKCGGKFVSSKSLTNHIRLHTGERPYPCNLCDESFLSASRRLEHQKRKHFEPAHKCSLCDAKFVTLHEKRKHLKRHFKPSSKLYITESDIVPPPTRLIIYPIR
ncbi:zinc finger protein 624-like [Pararge aegeria]|uniref:zinc finger protein 624-like n=1 Tax=Pararge aegeria TaxID=116150 RepID=UPI0019D0DD60|nr:zinc finger protein 624-like [Pararge aegeria]